MKWWKKLKRKNKSLHMTVAYIQGQINSITKQLIQKYKPTKIILFGSAAAGSMTPDSDLDFFIVKNDKKPKHDRMVEVYKLVDKDIAADFLVYTPEELATRVQMGDPFIKSVLSEGKVLYG